MSDSRKTYDPGLPPESRPLSHAVGSAFCLQYGELLPLAADPATLINGYPQGCYALADGLLYYRTSEFNSPALQVFWAWLIHLQYEGDTAAIDQLLLDMFGNDYAITQIPEAGPRPNIVIGSNPNSAFVSINGTSNYQQLALQSFDLLRRPQNFGILGASPTVYDQATNVIEEIEAAGIGPDTPIFITGHSYGGAIAQVVAARLHAHNPNRKVRILTYGSPKPGDTALANILRGIGGLSIQNDTDWVTVLPPDFLLSWPVQIALNNPLAPYREWDQSGHQAVQFADGKLIRSQALQMDSARLQSMVERALASLPQLPILRHSIEVYYKRAKMRAPGVSWPLTQAVEDQLPPSGLDNDCPSAVPMQLDETIEVIALGDVQHWFEIPVGAFQQLYLRLTVLAGDPGMFVDVGFGECDSIGWVGSIDAGCTDFFVPGVDAVAKIRFTQTEGFQHYTIELSETPCP